MNNFFNKGKDISKTIEDIKTDLNLIVVEEKRNMVIDSQRVAGCQPDVIQKLIYIGILHRPGTFRRELGDHLIDISSLALDYPELSALDLMMIQNILYNPGNLDTYERVIDSAKEKIRQIQEKKYQESLISNF